MPLLYTGTNKIGASLFASCFLLCACWLPAQTFMRPFSNAAAMALGDATIAYPGLAAGLTNSGQLGFGQKLGFYLGSAIPYGISDWKSAQFQGFAGLDKNSGLGLEVLHSGLEVYAEQRFRLLYGRKLGDKFYLGGNADLLRASAQEYGSATTATFGLSILAQALPKVWLGADVQNPLQQKMGDDVARSVLRIGAAWQASTLFTMLAEVEKDLERPVQIKAGLEYKPLPLLMLRAGMRAGSTARIGFGAGIRLKNGLALDVGSEWHPALGITPAAMVSWRK